MGPLNLKQTIELNFSAGSGLILWKNSFWAVTDNEESLYTLPLARLANPKTCLFKKIPLSERTGILPKSEKPDWESIGLLNEKLLLLPSFSTPQRRTAVLGVVGAFQWLKCDHLLDWLSRNMDEPNIEGFGISGNQIFLLQRGNSKSRENGLICATLEGFPVQVAQIHYQPWPLDPWTWTDMHWLDANRFIFTAAYEKSENTYEDGDVVGSKIGLADLTTQKTDWLFEIEKIKLEGLIHDPLTNRVYAISDPDDESKMSQLFILDTD